MNLSDQFHEWYDAPDHFALVNTLYLIFSTYIPIVGQMSSLVFGYLRKRQEEKMNEYVKTRKKLFGNPEEDY